MKEKNMISVKGLYKKYGKFEAVKKITFNVKEGEIFAFLGPNGAGKTTTIKMLTTLTKQTSGDIAVNGFNPSKEDKEVRSSIGIVFQDQSLDDELTAMENLVFHANVYNVPKDVYVKRIVKLLKLVELWDRKDSLVKTFSGGMKRRLEIARGLIHHPKILFLDEPTLGLDPQTRNLLWDYVKRLNRDENMTVFFTTHYMHEAEKYADMVAIIDHGKIVSFGTPNELKKKTKTKNLEEAFLKLTGQKIREEDFSQKDNIRNGAKMWGRR